MQTTPLKRVTLLLYALIYLVPLGVRPLLLPDETRYAEIPREMVASGNWVSPRFNGLRYFEKPPLGYWLNGISIAVFGENAWAVRLPAALAAGLTALLVFVLVRGRDGEDEVATWSAAVLLSSAFVYGIGTFAVLDMPVCLFLTATMVFFYRAYREQGRKRRLYEILAGSACGLAFLTKGFLAFAVPAVAIVPFLLWEKRAKAIVSMAWLPAFAVAAVSLPWCLAIHVREPGFWRYFFWEEHIRRFASGQAQHPEAPWFYLAILPLAVIPWTAVLPAAVRGLRLHTPSRDPLVRYALCWFVFPLLFFSASRGKLATYILPCLPPVAVLLAIGLLRDLKERVPNRLFAGGAAVCAALSGLLASALVLHGLAAFSLLPVYGDGQAGRWGLAVCASILAAGTFAAAVPSRESPRRLLLWAAATVPLLFAAGLIFPEEAEARKGPGDFLIVHSAGITPETVIVSDKTLAGAVCWYWRRDDAFILGGGGELDPGLDHPEAVGRQLNPNSFAGFIRDRRQAGLTTVVVGTARHYRDWLSVLPAPDNSAVSGSFALLEYRSATAPVAGVRTLDGPASPGKS